MEISVPEVGSYLEGFMCEVLCTNLVCSLVEICEKPCRKLGKVVSTILYIKQEITLLSLITCKRDTKLGICHHG